MSGFTDIISKATRAYLLLDYLNTYMEPASSVSIVTRLRAVRAGSIADIGREFFSSPPHPDHLWGPPSLIISNGYRGLFPGSKVIGREADHSPPSSAEVKNEWSYTSTHPYVFVAQGQLYLYRDTYTQDTNM
jgi:hypothetical protein